MRTNSALVILLLLLVGAGCSPNPYGTPLNQPRAMGRPIDENRAANLKKGVHTKQDVQNWFGTPTVNSVATPAPADGCIETWMYIYSIMSSMSPTQPITSNGTTLMVAFDKDGKVCRHNLTQNATGLQ